MNCDCKGQELVAVGAAAAVIIAKGRTPDELDALGNLFCLIGDSLSVISAQTSACEKA